MKSLRQIYVVGVVGLGLLPALASAATVQQKAHGDAVNFSFAYGQECKASYVHIYANTNVSRRDGTKISDGIAQVVVIPYDACTGETESSLIGAVYNPTYVQQRTAGSLAATVPLYRDGTFVENAIVSINWQSATQPSTGTTSTVTVTPYYIERSHTSGQFSSIADVTGSVFLDGVNVLDLSIPESEFGNFSSQSFTVRTRFSTKP
jgi:hypothetical protein